MARINRKQLLKRKLKRNTKTVDSDRVQPPEVSNINKLDMPKSKAEYKSELLNTMSGRGLLKKTISKKEKFRQKHRLLLNKFAVLKRQQKDEKAKKNREKTAIIGDLKPLRDALPSLSELFETSKNGTLKSGIREFDEPKKLNVQQKIKRNKKKFISKVKNFQSLLTDPDIRSNPRDVIAYHIKYTHLNEE